MIPVHCSRSSPVEADGDIVVSNELHCTNILVNKMGD